MSQTIHFKEPIIAVDFDGTLCENKWPDIGEPNLFIIKYLITMQRTVNARIILWTCRTGEMLNKAISWCSKYGLGFDAVNENLPHIIEKFGGDTRKIFADMYIDDKNFIRDFPEKFEAKLKSDFQTVVSTCNSLNALEGRYRFTEPEQITSSILHNAQMLIWLLWASLNESKGNPTSQEVKEVVKYAEN